MLITLNRKHSTHDSTIGVIGIDGAPICASLEDGFRSPKVPHFTRIPEGLFKVTFRTVGGFHGRYLKRFGTDFHKGMLWIRDVPEFEYVLFHMGNTVEDTDGCVIVGNKDLAPGPGFPNYRVAESEIAYRKFYPVARDALLSGEPLWVQISDDEKKDD